MTVNLLLCDQYALPRRVYTLRLSLILTASLLMFATWQQTTLSDVDACVLAVGAKGMRSIVAGARQTTTTVLHLVLNVQSGCMQSQLSTSYTLATAVRASYGIFRLSTPTAALC
jgi:hypothetical protein